MPPRKVVSSAPPTVVIRKKAVKPAPRPVQAQTVPSPPSSATAKSAPLPGDHPVPPTPSLPQPSSSSQAVPQPRAPALESPPAPPITAAASLSKTQQEKQARRELLDVCRQRWPQAFRQDLRHVKPLAIGIHRELAARLPEQPLRRISAVIGLFQRLSGAGYLRAIVKGGPRYDLEGNPRGEVTPKEQELAQRDLAAYYERRKARQQDRTSAAAAQAAPVSPANTG
jgi:ProP effector